MLDVHKFRHFILFSKGHYNYGSIDGWQDGLKLIVAKYCGFSKKLVTSEDCCILMGEAFSACYPHDRSADIL